MPYGDSRELVTMPKIPSSSELGWMGSWGRNGDTEIAHVAPGERIVPVEVIEQYPEVGQIISQAIRSMGADPNRYIVGRNNSINPKTGQPEFFFKKIAKAIKKVFKAVAKNPITRTLAIAASSLIPGAPAIVAPLVAGTLTKVSGGSWGQAIGSAAGTYLGSSVGSKLFGNSAVPSTGFGPVQPTAGLIGSGGKVFGAETVGQLLGSTGKALPGVIANASLSNAVGSYVGNMVGEGIGASIDPPKLPKSSWGEEAANYDIGQADLPQAPTSPTLAIPSSETANVSNALPNSPYPRGAGVSYLSTVKNRDTGRPETITVNNSFGQNFGQARRSGWGSAVFV